MVRNRMYVMLFIFSVVAFGLFMLCLKWSDRPRGWTFELWMNGHAPDINRYSIIYIEDRNNNDLPFGYPLYHDAMRAAGLRPLLLTERLFRDSGMYFKSENVKYFSKWNTPDCPGRFGTLQERDFIGHVDAVSCIRNTQAWSNAVEAIDANAGFRHVPTWGPSFYYDFVSEICGNCGIDDSDGNTTKDGAKEMAKEAITACAIKRAFPYMRTLSVFEERPLMDTFITANTKYWPIPIKCECVAKRTFRFYDEDGTMFAKLSIDMSSEPMALGSTAIHKAIFNQAFMDITSSNAILVRGRAYFDSVKECGVVCDVVHEATPLHNR